MLAASDTKDAEELLKPLLCKGDEVFVVEFGAVDGMPWVQPMAAEKLAEAARAVADVKVEVYGRDIVGALSAATEKREVVVAGKAVLVGSGAVAREVVVAGEVVARGIVGWRTV